MFDDLLNVGASFDLITLIVAYIQDWRDGPAAHFGVVPGYSRRRIKRLLKPHGVKVWGLMLSPGADMLLLAVNREQARLTYQIFEQNGVRCLVVPGDAVEQHQERGILSRVLR